MSEAPATALDPVPLAVIGRYRLYDVIGKGGLASVHIGRLMGAGGFCRTVAIKRLHPHLASDPEFATMLADEARLAARIRHPNVVQTLDVLATGGELLVVMDYVEGATLARLLAAGPAEPSAVSAVMTGVLEGLHAAHEATAEDGTPLNLVHRDVSPQNILVGADGVARLIDFGVAKAAGRARTTETGRVKGKLSYMAPEQVRGLPVTPRSDVFSASIVAWEAVTRTRLFSRSNEAETLLAVLEEPIPAASTVNPSAEGELDAVLAKGLSRDPALRFPSASEMARALEAAVPPAHARVVAGWVKKACDSELAKRAELVSRIESGSAGGKLTSPSSTRDSDGGAGQQPTRRIAPEAAADPATLRDPAPSETPEPQSTGELTEANRTKVSLTRASIPWRRESSGTMLVAALALVIAGWIWVVLSRKSEDPRQPLPAPATSTAQAAADSARGLGRQEAPGGSSAPDPPRQAKEDAGVAVRADPPPSGPKASPVGAPTTADARAGASGTPEKAKPAASGDRWRLRTRY